MARKPIQLEMKNKRVGGRQEIWELIRKQRKFSIKTLEGGTVNGNVDTIRDYVKSLEKAGFVKRLCFKSPDKKVLFNAVIWQLVKDVGVNAPRVNKNGELVTQGLAAEQMWRTIKMLSSFGIEELAITASTDECQIKPSYAKSYIISLAKAGYLAREGNSRKAGRYYLIPTCYTGSKPPMITRLKTVYDQNLNKIVWQETPDEW